MREPQTAQLATHIRYVLFGCHARVLAGLDGVLFCRKAESVVAHGVQNVLALHAMETRNGVSCDVSQRVANMQALT